MTRKDYERIAQAIAECKPVEDQPALAQAVARVRIIDAIADAMEDDNPRFQRAKFINACKARS
jgi:hypothetical protein